jgi:hypothetical protein
MRGRHEEEKQTYGRMEGQKTARVNLRPTVMSIIIKYIDLFSMWLSAISEFGNPEICQAHYQMGLAN